MRTTYNGLKFEVKDDKVKCLATGGYIRNEGKKKVIIEKAEKERKNLLKAKIIAKVADRVFGEGKEDMEEIQSEVAQELNEQAGVELEKANNTVRLVIAEFIRDNKVA